MKYKIGDKVKIVPKELIKGTANLLNVEKSLESLSPKRVVTIKRIGENGYYMKENHWWWPEEEIEFLEEKILEPIKDRFEILDL